MSTKYILVTVFYLITSLNATDYKQEFDVLISDNSVITDQLVADYFSPIENAQKVQAVSEITSDKDLDYTAQVFTLGLGEAINEPTVRDQLIQSINDPSYTITFRIVTVSSLETSLHDATSRDAYISALLECAQNQTESELLRGKAINVAGTFHRTDIVDVILLLLNENNDIVRNNCGRAIRKNIKYYPAAQKTVVIQKVSEVLFNQFQSIENMRAIVTTLGYAKDVQAEQELLNLLNLCEDEKSYCQIVHTLKHYPNTNNAVQIMNRYNDIINGQNLSDKSFLDLGVISFIQENESIYYSLASENSVEAQKAYLNALILLRSKDISQVEIASSFLGDTNADIRLLAIQALHYLLPNEEEKILFNEHRQNESDAEVLYWIHRYIGA